MSLKKYLCIRKFFIVCFCLGLVVISRRNSATYFLLFFFPAGYAIFYDTHSKTNDKPKTGNQK